MPAFVSHADESDDEKARTGFFLKLTKINEVNERNKKLVILQQLVGYISIRKKLQIFASERLVGLNV